MNNPAGITVLNLVRLGVDPRPALLLNVISDCGFWWGALWCECAQGRGCQYVLRLAGWYAVMLDHLYTNVGRAMGRAVLQQEAASAFTLHA